MYLCEYSKANSLHTDMPFGWDGDVVQIDTVLGCGSTFYVCVLFCLVLYGHLGFSVRVLSMRDKAQ